MYHSILFSPTTTTRRKKISYIFLYHNRSQLCSKSEEQHRIIERRKRRKRRCFQIVERYLIQTLQKIRAFPAVQRHVCVAMLARPCKKTTKIGQQSNAKCLRRSRSFVCSKYVGSVQPIFIQTLLDGEWKRARSISRYSL